MKAVNQIIEKIFLFLQKAELQGEDYYGNIYYKLKTKDAFNRKIRYVKFFDKKNISSIPPLWSAWLRYSIDDIKEVEASDKQKAQYVKPHQPNRTGVENVYYPANHILSSDHDKKINSVYKSWL